MMGRHVRHSARPSCRLLIAGGFALAVCAGSASARVVPPILTWTEDPQTTITVSWERDAPGRGTVDYGPTTNYGSSASDCGCSRRHAITLRGLVPGAAYHYQVVSGDGYATADRTFRAGCATTGMLALVVHGDLQGGCTVSAAEGVAAAICRAQPDLVITGGDMADDQFLPGWSTWASYFQITSNEFAQTVFMPAPGNHDDVSSDGATYFEVFSLPPRPCRERYYSYDVGPTHFMSLNSEIDIYSQTNWIQRDLQAAANNTNTSWIVAHYHRPAWTGGDHAPDYEIRAVWCPLFTRYGMDFVFNGHNHCYERTTPIDGVVYVVTGGGGATLYDSTAKPYIAIATTCYHHVELDMFPDHVNYRAIRSDDREFDTVVYTNRRPPVWFAPAFPLQEQAVTISYDAGSGPLAAANPVYIHLGLDDFSSAVASTAMTFNAVSGRWEYEYTVPTNAAWRLVCCFRDAAGATWDNNYAQNWQALLGRLELDPAMPVAGSNVTVRYQPALGPLAGAGALQLRAGLDNWQLSLADIALTNNPATRRWEASFAVPAYARRIDLAVHNGAAWDDHDGLYWGADVAGGSGAVAWPALPLLAAGSPVVTTNPPVVQNQVGDNVDFNVDGGALRALSSDGFGDFGAIYFNYDATNLYVGGLGASLGGTNNVFCLFLGFDTLTDNAETLWHKTGPPNTLDYLHNLKFSEPMDLAIVFGDEYGDAADYTNFTYGGYDFGQGLYYVGTNSTAFVPVPGAILSQFDGSNSVACATADDDGDRFTERWEARIPWTAVNAAGGITNMHCLLVAGVAASAGVSGNNRYLSATCIGQAADGQKDGYGNYGFGFLTLAPTLVSRPQDDYDYDGLRNDWEQEHFGSARAAAAGVEDADGDTLDNLEERVAGTDPTNAASVFAARSAVVDAGRRELAWPAATGRVYAILQSTNLLAGFVPYATNLPAAYPQGCHTVSVGQADGVYYSIRVRE